MANLDVIFFFAKMNSLQMSRAPPRSTPHSSGRCRVYTDGGSSQCVTNAVRRTMKALCQPSRRDKRKTEPVSLSTLAVPYIAPPHRHHNATPVQFFLRRWLGAVFGGFCGGQRKCRARPATTTAVRTRRPLCVSALFFSHVRHWTCCVPTSMQMTLLVAIGQPSDCFFLPWLNWGQCGLQQ